MKSSVFAIAGAVALVFAGQAFAADGKAIYDKACAGCHKAMAPKLGDKAAFAPLIKKGLDAITASVVKGGKVMPPKGGAASDADVKLAVEYMFNQSK